MYRFPCLSQRKLPQFRTSSRYIKKRLVLQFINFAHSSRSGKRSFLHGNIPLHRIKLWLQISASDIIKFPGWRGWRYTIRQSSHIYMKKRDLFRILFIRNSWYVHLMYVLCTMFKIAFFLVRNKMRVFYKMSASSVDPACYFLFQ